MGAQQIVRRTSHMAYLCSSEAYTQQGREQYEDATASTAGTQGVLLSADTRWDAD
jgi:hypothetical protein